MIRYPEQHFWVAVLCNSAETDPSALGRQVANIVLAKEIKAAGAATPAKEPAATSTTGTTLALTAEQMLEFTGLYWNRADDAYDRIFVKEGQLKVDGGDNEPLVLKPFGELRFHIADKPWGDEVEIHFVAATPDKPKRMEQSFGGGKPLVYEATEGLVRVDQSLLNGGRIQNFHFTKRAN